MKNAFIDFSSGRFDSAEMNLHFFSLYPSEFYEERKKDIEQLRSFTYAGQDKMQDRNLVLSGEHADR